MNIQIELLSVEQKSLLIQLMELYNYDFTLYEDVDVNEYGYYGYAHIDDYWNEDGRFPYLIRVNSKIAGFALICPHCDYIEGKNTRCISEFFVMFKYRRLGVGAYVANKIFDLHKGQWEVCHLNTNLPARNFWSEVIDEYTNGDYTECGTDKDVKRGFTFDNSQY